MNIAATIQINLQIMKLIKSKYADETFPAGFKTLEAKYYAALQADLGKVQSALQNGGLAEKVDPDKLI